MSKAEGRFVDLATVRPSARAYHLAKEVDKDPRLVEVILHESTEVVRHRKGVLIVAHRCGYVLANAGVDASNVQGSDTTVLLLPEDPEPILRGDPRAAPGPDRRRRPASSSTTVSGARGATAPSGRRSGAPGFPALLDLRGAPDLFGRALRTTEVGTADEIAAAASLLMGQADQGRPIVLVRGLDLPAGDGTSDDLIRPRELDLFR